MKFSEFAIREMFKAIEINSLIVIGYNTIHLNHFGIVVEPQDENDDIKNYVQIVRNIMYRFGLFVVTIAELNENGGCYFEAIVAMQMGVN